VEPSQVDCQLQERIAWVIPGREISLSHLEEVYVDTETYIREDEDGDEYTVVSNQVILLTVSGEYILKGEENIGITAQRTAVRLNNYLKTPTTEPLTVWGFNLLGHTLVTLGGGFIFIIFALSVVVAIIDMVIGLETLKMKIRRQE
jgi:hypothetical protein